MTHASTTLEEVPTSFGTFKPVGHLMVGVPTPEQSAALTQALLAAGWQADEVNTFTPRESADELAALIGNASGLAGFGYELTLMRRYLGLAREGYRWLLVKVEDSTNAAQATAIAKQHGAQLAVHYRSFTVEELI